MGDDIGRAGLGFLDEFPVMGKEVPLLALLLQDS